MTSGTSHLGTRARPASSAPFSRFFHEKKKAGTVAGCAVVHMDAAAVDLQPPMRLVRRLDGHMPEKQ